MNLGNWSTRLITELLTDLVKYILASQDDQDGDSRYDVQQNVRLGLLRIQPDLGFAQETISHAVGQRGLDWGRINLKECNAMRCVSLQHGTMGSDTSHMSIMHLIVVECSIG